MVAAGLKNEIIKFFFSLCMIGEIMPSIQANSNFTTLTW